MVGNIEMIHVIDCLEDKALLKLAGDLGISDQIPLGIALGFKYTEVMTIIQNNYNTNNATLHMLVVSKSYI